MKYNSSNKPLVCMQTQSSCYKGTRTMTVLGVLWHSTGANNPNIKRYVQPSDTKPSADTYSKAKWLEVLGKNSYGNDWNHISYEAGLNAWIGKLADGSIATVQTMPWNYRPWGCGSGSKGSCNSGWIQFEICEDSLSSKDYFEKVYKEACELTAYLCDMYNLDPKGTQTVNGVKVPVILCHQDSYKLGLGSNHGDVYHWFKKYGKDMDDVRNDVAALMKKPAAVQKPEEPAKPLYRVRKDWKDAASQKGAFAVLENAKKACDEAGKDYKVFDEKGKVVYPEVKVEAPKPAEPAKPAAPSTPAPKKLKVGDEIKLVSGATYADGKKIPSWLFGSKLYLRQIYANGNYVVSTLKSGAVTGVVKPSAVVAYNSGFKPYTVIIDTAVLNVRAGAGTNYKITTKVKKNEIFTIVSEKNGWGELKSGAGWISLNYTKKYK